MSNLFNTWFNVGPLTILVLLLLIVVVWQAIKLVKSIRNKKDDRSWRVITVVLSLLVLLPTAFFEVRLQFSNATITGIMRQISGNPSVRARCQRSMGDTLNLNIYTAHGLAYFDKGLSIIDSARCHDFMAWYLSDKTQANDNQVWSTGVLIHETVHLEGQRDEAITECETMERYERVASEIMGAPRDEAIRMSEIYKTKFHTHTPKSYQMDCDAYWDSKNNIDKDESKDDES